jgi:hypothetical protein
MPKKEYIPLNRLFSPVQNQKEAENEEIHLAPGHLKLKTWGDIAGEFRCVILAAAGFGKTKELRYQAQSLADQGKPSFFIRIESIEFNIYEAFEIGKKAQFDEWLCSKEEDKKEAWFFLDSIDEARLENQKKFRDALRCFANSIKKGTNRAHIYLSSRPYAWRFNEDKALLDELLPFSITPGKDGTQENKTNKSALTIYKMRPLDEERIRKFCIAHKAKNLDLLLDNIKQSNLWCLAERPFDLEYILKKWANDQSLGSRLEMFRSNIAMQLSEKHNTDRDQSHNTLTSEKSKKGAQLLAASVFLTGNPNFNVPENSTEKTGVDAEAILVDWEKKDICTLLQLGIFNDIIYGAVRFRHREVVALLAAEYFNELLQSGNSRYEIENLFFHEEYGEKVIRPRLRPILPWLILLDQKIRSKALDIDPAIVLEGGDPSTLPLVVREIFLKNIVDQIALGKNDRSKHDAAAIIQFATFDLSEVLQTLIQKYHNNDHAISFLGYLVWRGKIEQCANHFVDIAVNSARGIHTRIISARVVMTCGAAEQKQALWNSLNTQNLLDPALFAKVIANAEPNSNSIDHLMVSLEKLPPYNEDSFADLEFALHEFLERFSVESHQENIIKLIDGLHIYLKKPAYIEPRDYHVSRQYRWLLKPALYLVEKLVTARNSAVFEATAQSIMLMSPALHCWLSNAFRSCHFYQCNLPTLVQNWPELNDALYWASISQERIKKTAESIEPLTNDDSIIWQGHFWGFDSNSLPRLLDYMRSQKLEDDRLVALNRAFRVYSNEGKLPRILSTLQDAVDGNPILKDQLNHLLESLEQAKIQRDAEKITDEQNKKDDEENNNPRDLWIKKLRDNPDVIRHLPDVKVGDISNDQYWLMQQFDDVYNCDDWQFLIPEFGDAVAHAYRDAAINHWQNYIPEEIPTKNSTPYSLIFAMAGLNIATAEIPNFIHGLSESQARHALRYISWELHGFPIWFESIYNEFPALVMNTVMQRLLLELKNTSPKGDLDNSILKDITYYASWLYAPIAPIILEWMKNNPTRVNIYRYHFLHILANGGTPSDTVAELAVLQIVQSSDSHITAFWYAIYVDADPENAIAQVDQWLSKLEKNSATSAAEIFITELMGYYSTKKPYFDHVKTARHLKSLYVLMHRYIRVDEDNSHRNGESYTPNRRNEAQGARERLFNMLLETPGKESYLSIKELIDDHPYIPCRQFMAKYAYNRAEVDSDQGLWDATQVSEFNKNQIITPETHQQLFELTVHRLRDLQNWLEGGHDSPYKTWQRAECENEMRNLIAGWLNIRSREQYTAAQEPELANAQRIDIQVHNTKVKSPVPIELKLLDKKWTGPKLCERLRNQLVGDYLREKSADCGVMLLISQKVDDKKSWEINGKTVGLNELENAMKSYWESISSQYPKVEEIAVIVIDLTKRDKISRS